MGWSRTRIIQFVEWWPISFDSNLEKQVDANICIKLNCSPQLFNVHWRHQLQYTVMIMSLVTRVQGSNYAHWRKRPRPHPAQHTEVGNHLMTPLSKSNLSMVMSPCSLKQWCDVKPGLHPKSQRKGAHQAQKQLHMVRVRNVPNERV